jgi:hypothetical protein
MSEYGAWWNDINREGPKDSKKNLSQCHLVQHKMPHGLTWAQIGGSVNRSVFVNITLWRNVWERTYRLFSDILPQTEARSQHHAEWKSDLPYSVNLLFYCNRCQHVERAGKVYVSTSIMLQCYLIKTLVLLWHDLSYHMDYSSPSMLWSFYCHSTIHNLSFDTKLLNYLGMNVARVVYLRCFIGN